MHEHVWRFLGSLAPSHPRASSVVCDAPNLLRCDGCAVEVALRCATSRESKCTPCARAYKHRVRRVAGSGLRGRRLVTVGGGFLTLTAPGDREHRIPGAERPCRCTPPGGVEMGAWNAGAGARFNRLMRDLRRLPGLESLEYFKAAEVQKRGALHFHVLVRLGEGGVLALSLEQLRELALKHGFGHEVDVQPVDPKHVRYVAKYVAKAADQRPSVPWRRLRHKRVRLVDQHGEIVVDRVDTWTDRHATYRTWSGSRRWGLAMRQIVADQAHYAATVLALPAWGPPPVPGGEGRSPHPAPDPPPCATDDGSGSF